MMKKLHIIVLIIFFAEALVFSQVKFKHYGIGEGFSDNSVRQIIQDKKGFLWFGTLNGLNRYDGNDIKIFKTVHGDTGSLSYSRISKLMEDSLGYIWVYTFDNEIHRFNPRFQNFINLNKFISYYGRTDINDNIIETSSGTLWMILRFGGLVRFRERPDADDYKIDILDTSNLLPDNFVNFVYKDDSGSLWIGTNKGLLKFNTDTFSLSGKTNHMSFGTEEGISFTQTCHTKKFIYFSTKVNGLYIIAPGEKNIENEFKHIPLKGTIRGMESGNTDDVLVVTENDGVYYLKKEAENINRFDSKDVSISQDLNLDLFTIYVDRLGKFWITSGRRGVTHFDPQKTSFTYYSLNAKQRESQGDDDKHIFFEDSNHDFWIGIYGGGLFKFDREIQQFIQYQHQQEYSYSLSSNYVLSILEDHSKNLWIGTFQGGLNKTELLRYDFKFTQPEQNAVLHTMNEVRSILYDSQDRLWIGTKEGFIYCYNPNGDIVYTIPTDLGSKEFIKSNIYSMIEDNNGNLWIGSKGAGLIRINRILKAENLNEGSYKINHFTNDPDNSQSLSYDAVYALYQDHLGQIWVGTHNGGLDLIENPSEKITFRHFVYSAGDSTSICDQRIRYITQDSKNNLWIGTSDGLNLLKAEYVGSKNKVFVTFKNDLSNKSSISNNFIFYIHEDYAGRIWIATSGGGINLLHTDEKTGKFWFTHYDRQHGLPGDVIFSILEDNKGNLWLGTDNGLCKFSPEGKGIDNYIAEEGLEDNLFSESTCAITSQGILVFGQKSGFIRFFPDSVLKEKKNYPVVITDFSIFNKRQLPGSEKSPLLTSMESTQSITLKHNQNFISFQYAILDYMHPERCQYAYYLQGIENDWNYVGNTHVASYTNLSPGRYIFHVKASNHEGYWNETPVSVELIITPPFWKTVWFRFLVFMFSISFLLGIYYYRVNNLKRQKMQLETLVQKRTSEIEEKNKTLTEQTYLLNETNTLLEERQQYIEEQSEELRTQADELNEKNQNLRTLNMTKDKFFSIIAHDLKNPFNAVLGFSELLSTKYDVVPEEKRKQYIEVIFDSVQKIYKLLENLLQWARLQTDNIPFNPENILLEEIINNNIELSYNQINEKNLKIIKDIPEGIKIYADKNMINTVLRNLITNAIKFTEAGNIKIEATTFDDSVICKISDTGIGISKSKIKSIFEVGNSKSTEGTRGESGTGLGLIICKEFVEKNGGKISVESIDNTGSTFSFTLPSKP